MTTPKKKKSLTNLRSLPQKGRKRSGKRANHEGSIYYWEAKNLWVASVRLGVNPKTGRPVRKKKYAHSQQEALASPIPTYRPFSCPMTAWRWKAKTPSSGS